MEISVQIEEKYYGPKEKALYLIRYKRIYMRENIILNYESSLYLPWEESAEFFSRPKAICQKAYVCWNLFFKYSWTGLVQK